MFVISDAAQSFGATYKGKRVGTQALVTTTSFFPGEAAWLLRRRRRGIHRRRQGCGNAPLDPRARAGRRQVRQRADRHDRPPRYDIQAAVLIEKLKIFQDEIGARNRVAARYNAGLKDVAIVPEVASGYGSVWAQYTIRVEKRDALVAVLANARRADRDLLPEAPAPAGALQAIRLPATACRLRTSSRPKSFRCRCILISTSRRRIA